MKHEKPAARIVPGRRPASVEVQKAVRDLDAIRHRMAERRGFKLIADGEIRDAIRKGRR